MPTTTVRFSLLPESSDAPEIVILGPQSNQPVDMLARYVTGLTANGTRRSYQKNTAENRLWSLKFDLNGTDKAALEDFYLTDAGGPTTQFSYTHTDGNSYTARFVNTSLPWTRTGPDQWTIQLTLEVLAAIG